MRPYPVYDFGGACFQAGGGLGLPVLAVAEGAWAQHSTVKSPETGIAPVPTLT